MRKNLGEGKREKGKANTRMHYQLNLLWTFSGTYGMPLKIFHFRINTEKHLQSSLGVCKREWFQETSPLPKSSKDTQAPYIKWCGVCT